MYCKVCRKIYRVYDSMPYFIYTPAFYEGPKGTKKFSQLISPWSVFSNFIPNLKVSRLIICHLYYVLSN